jgi:hypothetical protein
MSTNQRACEVLLPNGQGVLVPPGAWPVTLAAAVRVTVVREAAQLLALLSDEALQGAVLISYQKHNTSTYNI